MNKEAIHKIAQHYSYNVQSRQCIEEMAELTQAINKMWRAKNDAINATSELEKLQLDITFMARKRNAIEEIADVQIILWQLEYLLNADVEPIIEQKISRQLERIERE